MSALSLDLASPAVWGPAARLLEMHWDRCRTAKPSLSDLMYMGSLAAPERETIFLYKHRRTRAYLCLDRAGHAYEVRITEQGPDVRPLRDAASALSRLSPRLRPCPAMPLPKESRTFARPTNRVDRQSPESA